MKFGILCLLFPVILLGCSKKSAESNTQSQNKSPSTATGLPFRPIVVEPPETKEIYNTKFQANRLFESKDFDGLDALAKQFRASKQCYAQGTWRLFYFYDGINFPENATDSEWNTHLATLREWLKTKPDSMTARVALANVLIDYAWKARGHGYADQVKDEGWKLFSQRLNEAVDVLNSAKTLKEQCPCWWVALLRAELGLQVERQQYDATFNAAIQAWPDYTALYFSRAHFLLPRWYGAAGELEKDMESNADKIGGDTGDIQYAQVIWYLHGDVFSPNMFEEYKLSWDRANKGLQLIERHYPDSLAVKNEAAHLAFLAHDAQAAKQYFDQTKGEIDPSAWSSTNDFIRCATLVYE